MELRKRKGNHTEVLADSMFYWLSVLVTAGAAMAVFLVSAGLVSSTWSNVIGLTICGAVSWTVYFLHQRYVLPDTDSRHPSAFLGIALLLFLCLYNPLEFTGIWNVFLIYPLYLSFFHEKWLLFTWGTISGLVYLLSVVAGMEQHALMDVFAHVTLAMGSVICAWLGFFSLSKWVGGAKREADIKKREYVMSLLNELVPVVERKTHTSSREIEQMGRLIKRLLQEFPEETVSDWEINLLSLLHYVSRIKWPDYLFEKEGKLTTYEYQLIQEHCYMGTELFKDDPSYQRVITALRHHHERYDGTGYPAQLKEKEIPLLAQALGIVECFIAMTAVRAYRGPFTVEEAYEQICLMAGTAYDEQIVQAFTRTVQIQASKRVPDVPPMVG
ncbi:hypothetical protein NDK47_02845 [Brevibacillus ruminantium]|uniref:HD-GYP domain-containing protein n=1 Tax=Brevibacillus ruminantium TaxID=2950604 RepID=A0ABY4WJP6_9BACL|nr:HD domain-containing phosphohydrolase [Brevibacillus ruminantium]USG66287.1 hypothetical protein NDK47_02845 [Brevibacillus ruminantium]